jgi:hypothetical protein
MKFRQLEWLSDFVFYVVAIAAGNALYKLHSAGQPLLGVVSESIFVAAGVTLLKYAWKHGDKEVQLPRPK